MKETEITLKDLTGKHFLSGVGFDAVPDPEGYEDANIIDFIIDDKIISAIEDYNDSYRSCMQKLVVNRSGADIKNKFNPVEVVGTFREDSNDEINDVIDFTDTNNGKIILSVGTENTDDYYPLFVSAWIPENLSVNN